jgi:hypothetical protein
VVEVEPDPSRVASAPPTLKPVGAARAREVSKVVMRMEVRIVLMSDQMKVGNRGANASKGRGFKWSLKDGRETLRWSL